jgi:hypothetical protein
MATFSGKSHKWSSSGQGGTDLKISSGPAESLFPDIDIDRGGGVASVWQDTRLAQQDSDQHEEIFAIYCPRIGHTTPHFPPLVPNIEARMDFAVEIVDPVTLRPVTFVNVPQTSLKIHAPGATFIRAANEDGQFSEWQAFTPNVDLDTMVVPWNLTCNNGQKQVCVQIQDQTSVSFPICNNVTLGVPVPSFTIELFRDEGMTVPLPTFQGRPVAAEGEIFVKLTTSEQIVSPPVFDVISRGLRIIANQETTPLDGSGASGASGFSGLGSFVGAAEGSGTAGRGFSGESGRVFIGKFNVRHEDGLFYIDGPARIVPRVTTSCQPTSA